MVCTAKIKENVIKHILNQLNVIYQLTVLYADCCMLLYAACGDCEY